MPGAPRPFDMEAHISSGSDDEPALRVPPESDELAEEARPVSQDPAERGRGWPEEGVQHEDESVAQILAGVSSSHANPHVQGRWVDADRSVSPPFLRTGPHLILTPQSLRPDTAPLHIFAAGVLHQSRGDCRV